MRIELIKGDLVLELDPAAGGAVSRFSLGDLDILRPAPSRCGPAFDPLQYAAFPMTPFVGRIHHGVFSANGQIIELHPNLPPEPHAIHGHGWKTAWKTEMQTKDEVTLVYTHTADAWPWDYETRQHFKLRDDGLVVRLELTNLGSTPMPAGLGWHPYFYRKNAVLTLPTTHEWCPDEDSGENIPVEISPDRNLSGGVSVESLRLDTAFRVSSPDIRVTWPTHAVTLTSDPVFKHATVFVPIGKDFFCAEPITHAPNAVNSKLPADVTGARELAEGETLSGTIRLSIER
ncbi:MAG: aldose 1-epimerase [Pseudomonadota bacterium]